VAARFGEEDRTVAALERLLSTPYSGAMGEPLTPALLRLDPMFDPLRADPRFQKLAASPTRKLQSRNRAEQLEVSASRWHQGILLEIRVYGCRAEKSRDEFD
jgi:hypothetical protein